MGGKVQSTLNTSEEMEGSETTSDELLWVVSASLLTASQCCTDVATQSSLFQYQHASTGREFDSLGDRNLENVRQSLEAAKEDIDLALDALEELDGQSTSE